MPTADRETVAVDSEKSNASSLTHSANSPLVQSAFNSGSPEFDMTWKSDEHQITAKEMLTGTETALQNSSDIQVDQEWHSTEKNEDANTGPTPSLQDGESSDAAATSDSSRSSSQSDLSVTNTHAKTVSQSSAEPGVEYPPSSPYRHSTENVRSIQRQGSLNNPSGGGANLLKQSVINRAAEAGGLSGGSRTAARPSTPTLSRLGHDSMETLDPNIPRSPASSISSFRIHGVHALAAPRDSKHRSSYILTTPTSSTARIPSVVVDMVDMPYSPSIYSQVYPPTYFNLPTPDYDADDLEEERRLQQKFAREIPAGAILFTAGFLFFPLWWIGAILRVPSAPGDGTDDQKGKAPEGTSAGQGTGETLRRRARIHRRWRTLNRSMTAISLLVLAAVVGLLLWWHYGYAS
jgi:hypothetical protein